MQRPAKKVLDHAALARVRALTARSVANGARTKARILGVAERLFADNGFDGVSMREIAQEAEVPLASVAYHFTSKLGLYKAVFRAHLEDNAKLRIARLEGAESPDDRAKTVRSIARVLVESIVRLETAPEGRNVARLVAREINDPRESERGIVEDYFDPVARAAIAILTRMFPEVERPSVYWAYLFATGALAINRASTGRIERLSDGLCSSDDAQAIIDNLIQFITGGILAAFAANSRSPRVPTAVSSGSARKTMAHRLPRSTKRAIDST